MGPHEPHGSRRGMWPADRGRCLWGLLPGLQQPGGPKRWLWPWSNRRDTYIDIYTHTYRWYIYIFTYVYIYIYTYNHVYVFVYIYIAHRFLYFKLFLSCVSEMSQVMLVYQSITVVGDICFRPKVYPAMGWFVEDLLQNIWWGPKWDALSLIICQSSFNIHQFDVNVPSIIHQWSINKTYTYCFSINHPLMIHELVLRSLMINDSLIIH